MAMIIGTEQISEAPSDMV